MRETPGPRKTVDREMSSARGNASRRIAFWLLRSCLTQKPPWRQSSILSVESTMFIGPAAMGPENGRGPVDEFRRSEREFRRQTLVSLVRVDIDGFAATDGHHRLHHRRIDLLRDEAHGHVGKADKAPASGWPANAVGTVDIRLFCERPNCRWASSRPRTVVIRRFAHHCRIGQSVLDVSYPCPAVPSQATRPGGLCRKQWALPAQSPPPPKGGPGIGPPFWLPGFRI